MVYVKKAKGGEYKPRIVIEVSEATFQRAARLLPIGTRKQVLSAVLEQVLDLMEEDANMVPAAIIRKQLTVKDMLRIKPKDVK